MGVERKRKPSEKRIEGTGVFADHWSWVLWNRVEEFQELESGRHTVRKGNSQHLIKIGIWKRSSFLGVSPRLLPVTDINRGKDMSGNVLKKSCIWDVGEGILPRAWKFWESLLIYHDGLSGSFLISSDWQLWEKLLPLRAIVSTNKIEKKDVGLWNPSHLSLCPSSATKEEGQLLSFFTQVPFCLPVNSRSSESDCVYITIWL